MSWLPNLKKVQSRPVAFAASALLGALGPFAVMMFVSEPEARWIEVGRQEMTTYYAKPATIGSTGNIVKMWVLYDYDAAQLIGKGKPYRSKKLQSEWDCNTKEARLLSWSSHAGRMGAGDVVDTYSGPRKKWEAVPPSSVGEELWRFACGKRDTANRISIETS